MLRTLRPDGQGGYIVEKGTDPVTLQKPKPQPWTGTLTNESKERAA